MTKDIIKRLIGLAFVTTLVATLVYICNSSERSTKEIVKSIERRHQHYRDSIDQVMKLKNDSLEIAFTTIRVQSERIRAAEKEAGKVRIRYEKVPFVAHQTDSTRDQAMTNLYPTYPTVEPESPKYAMPVVYVDSVIYDANKGRICDTLQRSYSQVIQEQKALLETNATAIRLQGEQLGSYELITASWASQYDEREVIYKKEVKGLKRIIFKLVAGNAFLTAVVIVLLL